MQARRAPAHSITLIWLVFSVAAPLVPIPEVQAFPLNEELSRDAQRNQATCGPPEVLNVALGELLRSLNDTCVSQQAVPTTWDRLLVAQALAQASPRDAADRLSGVFRAQQADGLVPHLVYPPQSSDGSSNCTPFPPPNVWTLDGTAATSSGLASPPMHATTALAILFLWMSGPPPWPTAPSGAGHEEMAFGSGSGGQPDRTAALAWAAELWMPLFLWYRWIFTHRCLALPGLSCGSASSGLYWLASPWESAVPSSVAWARVLAGSVPGYLPRMSANASRVWALMREGLSEPPPDVAGSAAFPGWEAYNNSWAATACVVGCSYASACVLAQCPFVVASAADNALLARAVIDLRTLMQWLQTSGPAPSGSAHPTVTPDQAAAVNAWAGSGAGPSTTADAVLQLLLLQPGSLAQPFAWAVDAALLWQPLDASRTVPPTEPLRLGTLLNRSWAPLINTSVGAASAVLGMPDAAPAATAGSWRASLMLALADSPAWAQPRLVSLARTDSAFRPGNPGYGGAIWADVTWMLWAALTSSSAGTTLLPSEAPLAAAVAEGLALCNCAAWGRGGDGGLRSVLGPLHGAFDASAPAACEPLANSTGAFSGGGTGRALAAVTVLTLRPPVVAAPLPGAMPGFAGIVIAMSAELILVAGIALGCVVFGGQQVRLLTASSRASRGASGGSGAKSVERGMKSRWGAPPRAGGSLNAGVEAESSSPPSSSPTRLGASPAAFWSEDPGSAPEAETAAGRDGASGGEDEDEVSALQQVPAQFVRPPSPPALMQANWWMRWYGDDEGGGGDGEWVDADVDALNQQMSGGVSCCCRRVSNEAAPVAWPDSAGSSRDNSPFFVTLNGSRDAELRRPLISEDVSALRFAAVPAFAGSDAALPAAPPRGGNGLTAVPVRSALRSSRLPTEVDGGDGGAALATAKRGFVPVVAGPPVLQVGIAGEPMRATAPSGSLDAPTPRRRSVRFMLDPSAGGSEAGGDARIDDGDSRLAAPVAADPAAVAHVALAAPDPRSPQPTAAPVVIASPPASPSTPTSVGGSDVTSTVLALHSPSPAGATVTPGGMDIGAAGAGLVRSVLSFPGALWSFVSVGGADEEDLATESENRDAAASGVSAGSDEA